MKSKGYIIYIYFYEGSTDKPSAMLCDSHGKERKGKERKGKERKGKERKGKERKGKARARARARESRSERVYE